jgi:glutamate-1-semialdehyde 2,1-aminomutase
MTSQNFSKSNDLYQRAINAIPLGSQTFSKSAMQYVKGVSPLFIESGKGSIVQDIDGNEFIDYIMGLMPVVLGYQDPDVDAAIIKQLGSGITFSLATELEVLLAERLIDLVPCAEMVRYGKNGSDVTTAAIRLARAHTGREQIAICGYHGWHDWYIGTTARDIGVPESVKSLSFTFPYNDADALGDMLAADPEGFAAVILEPTSGVEPEAGFLERLRELTFKYGVLLIFDEVVTGFRVDLGGAQKYYGVTPDLATFGKSMANGMPISAIVGQREFMRTMDDIFFSTTFGGEALSLAASLATIDKLEASNALPRISNLGSRISARLDELLIKHDLEEHFRVSGADWYPIFSSKKSHISDITINSLLRQELVANGILALPSLHLCLAHDNQDVFSRTITGWNQALEAVGEAIRSNDPGARLRGAPIEDVFKVRASR